MNTISSFERITRAAAMLALCALTATGCGNCGEDAPGGTTPTNNGTKEDMSDMSDVKLDMPGDMDTPDMKPVPDMPDMKPAPDMKVEMDSGNNGDEDMSDMAPDTDMKPVVDDRTCPVDLRASCIYNTLSCLDGSTEFQQCSRDVFGREYVTYNGGGEAVYEVLESNGEQYLVFRTISTTDRMCFKADALVSGDAPDVWKVQDGNSMFVYNLQFNGEDDTVTITCPGDVVEICSREKFDLFFKWPFEGPGMCDDRLPEDQCGLDTDCPTGELCCQTADTEPKRCLSADICLPNRDPIDCTKDTDCPPDYECSKCRTGDRTGRECVPQGFSDSAMNTLGCEPDNCNPDDPNACAEPRTCCLNGDSFSCVIPSECDTYDPNPTCQVNEQQPCSDPTQQCCYVDVLQEFRCIDGSAACRTNICFNDTECPSAQECCGANPASGIAGACLTQCEFTETPCATDPDCDDAFGEGLGGFCCKYPGYTAGTCVADPNGCTLGIFTCPNGSDDCSGGEFCCNAAPLTEPVCLIAGDQCPPL